MANNINIAELTKRPGIKIQEIDQSIRRSPVQQELINLVPGFSRKGVFNRPVLISTPQELQNIFGNIDRNLERKGSFFHRTIQNILNQSPVYALNLLKVDDNKDKIEFKSISTSVKSNNRQIQKAPYSNFFNRSEFWERDTDAFLNVAEENAIEGDKILHITNMSDKKITVFMFKSPLGGFDITAEEWYEGADNVPPYIYPDDLISDYMVRVHVVAGDWSNVSKLSVDSRWSQYFNSKGLRKNQVTNFLNDNAVNLLSSYDASLIPFFRDQNGRNLYIETLINRDTDETGLFVAFDTDKFETDNPNGLVDLIGHTIVDENKENINFLSYKEKITEFMSFKTIENDSPGNVFKNASGVVSGNSETGQTGGTISFNQNDQNGSTKLTLTNSDLNYVINGAKTNVESGQELIIDYVNNGRIRKDTVYIDTLGQLGVTTGNEVSNLTAWDNVPLKDIPAATFPVAILWVGSKGTSGGNGVSNINALPKLTISTAGTAGADILLTQPNNYTVDITFANTKNSDPDTEYAKTRLLQIFNTLQGSLLSGTSLISTLNGFKPIQSIEVTDGSTQNKAIRLTVVNTLTIDVGNFELYYQDIEFTLGQLGAKTSATNTGTSGGQYGRVGKNSQIYEAYKDGDINTGDFFYPQLIDPTSLGGNNDHILPVVEFGQTSNGDGQIIFWTDINLSTLDDDEFDAQGGDKIYINGSSKNDKIFSILSYTKESGPFTVSGTSYNFKYTLVVSESTMSETVQDNVTLHDGNADEIVYLKMFFINDDLHIEFVNSSDILSAGDQKINPNFNPIIRVHSEKGNIKQTLEIENVLEINQVVVDADRYGEIRVGDFLEAYVNQSELEIGEVPKKYTRITNKKRYSSDPTKIVLTTDNQINISDFNGDKQTLVFKSIEKYVNSYQPITLNGFKVRKESMPDGTEERQNDILNILAPNTPIFKGLINKNKISWRYLIDSFSNGLTANSKQQFVDLCGTRLNCLGLLNMPSAKQFKNSSSPSFTNSDGILNTEFISLGGDPESNPSFTYSFGSGNGQSTVSYFFPHVIIDDNGRPLITPPSSFVANTFMRKHNSRQSNIHPWTIAAGIRNGRVNGISDVEKDLTPEDIENLNVMKANPIVFKMNRGFVIETNNTAQKVPQSALSFINVREVLIELENELFNMLLTFQWSFNTQETRSEIKRRADNITTRFINQDGLFNALNIIDETNNTPEIIDNQIGVLDTYVEPIKGMATILNRITVLSTGEIESGGFQLNTA